MKMEHLNNVIGWKIFANILNRDFAKENKGIGGRPD